MKTSRTRLVIGVAAVSALGLGAPRPREAPVQATHP